jgi:chromosome segregation protein
MQERSKVEVQLKNSKVAIEECIQSINKLESEKFEKEKGERINLLDKTEEFANLQAKLATIASQDGYLESNIKDSGEAITNSSKEISEMSEPIQSAQESLDQLLKGRLKVESQLLIARKAIEQCSQSINEFEREKIEKEQMAVNLREALEVHRLERQASKIEAENIEKQLLESDNVLSDLLFELTEEQTTGKLEEEIEAIEKKISRLGAINLAAMEEYEQEEKRKTLLDDQHLELTNALETLQNAINKIDKETRTTFKDTFDELNLSLAKSFPKLFGGGHAELVILGDDLLSAGVGISARPPGKKNSSVSQLSGGEKALTAIAIVFAFFELNPSPFCMLDEVDAPLDDLNTMRFIDLVEEMSKKVQFVYITHNKISMEKSKHLMGVTMQEPGVSRMVSVDVDEAVEMAAS